MKRGWATIREAAARPGGRGLGRRRTAQGEQDEAGGEGENGGARIGAGESHRGEEILRIDHRLRPDHGRADTAEHHPGDHLRHDRRACRIGGGEAVLLDEGRGEADRQMTEDEQPEIPVHDRQHRDDAARQRYRRAGDEAAAPADPAHQIGGGNRPEGSPEDEGADGQRRQRLVGTEQIGAGKAAERDDDGRHGAAYGLGDRQHQRVATGHAVIDELAQDFPSRSGGARK